MGIFDKINKLQKSRHIQPTGWQQSKNNPKNTYRKVHGYNLFVSDLGDKFSCKILNFKSGGVQYLPSTNSLDSAKKLCEDALANLLKETTA